MTALVTGAGKRLGRAMALYLAGRGHDVAVHYASSADAAEAVAAEVRAVGRHAVTLQADLLEEDAMQALVPAAVAALGSLTVLVNNASIFEYDSLQTATKESWDRHLLSNLRAPYVLTQAFARQCPAFTLDEAEEPLAQGLIVNMIDQRILKLTPEFSSYTIAKMGLWALTRTSAQGLAPNIRVNAIGPGPTLRGARQSKEHFAKQRAATVLGRGANPADITAALGFFLDSPSVTGQFLAIDAGQHLAWKTPDVIGLE
ncbi:SDR family oxidoreductase [Tabrizicola sp.]|uniref:SDR family oxidoreductase n=1 Tax=Tabrizicola sp. TaxID=2005166 RepID=UPI00286B17F8|nr:SDR family oxidoreductase [Tabrizicola sp.]